ncbi:MAG: ACP S-malonyltransferase [Thermoflexales bacterium]|nr:ACP S-malonyltransferase [Thermoflexales bacterium]
MSVAFVFPGQGSQYAGMGKALAEAYPEARQVFEQADQALGFALSSLCFEGPEDSLTDTINAQPAILATSFAALQVIRQQLGSDWQPILVAGHSMGEFSALVCAGVLSFEAGLHLVRERGRLMKRAGELFPGRMAAIIKLERETLIELCTEACAATGGVVQIANDNAPGQIVISGDKPTLEKALELARARGAKRCIPLAVSIPAHSALMTQAAQEFRVVLDQVAFATPAVPVVGNVEARPVKLEKLCDELEAQLVSPVRWTESVQYIANQGVDCFVEIGPKDVLSGLVKRIDPGVTTCSVGDPEGLAALL